MTNEPNSPALASPMPATASKEAPMPGMTPGIQKANSTNARETLHETQSKLQKRFDEMTSRNERLLEALQRSNDLIETMESKWSQPQPQHQPAATAPKGELANLSMEDLYLAEVEYSNPQSEHYKPGALAKIRSEISQRNRESILSEVEKKFSGEKESMSLKEMNKTAFEEGILSLGEDKSLFLDANGRLNREAPAFKFANQLYTQYHKKYGDLALKVPELQKLAVFSARDYVRSQSPREPAPETEDLLRRQRIRDSVTGQGEAAVEVANTVRAHLDKGDFKSALRSLPIIQGLEEDLRNT